MSNDAPLPIATATVARLCLSQGRLAQAESLFRHLLQTDPDNSALLDGLRQVLSQKEAENAPRTGDRVTMERTAPQSLRCAWAVTPEGQRRAQLVLGGPGHLVLRVVSFPQSAPEKPVDRPLQQPQGVAPVQPREQATLIMAAVGLLGPDKRFVSIAHSPFLALN